MRIFDTMMDAFQLPDQRNTLVLVIVVTLIGMMSVESGASGRSDLDLAGAKQCQKDLMQIGYRRRLISRLQAELSGLRDERYASSDTQEKNNMKVKMDVVSDKLKSVRDSLYGEQMPRYEEACLSRNMKFEIYQEICASDWQRTRGFCSQYYMYALQLDSKGAKQCIEMSQGLDTRVSVMRKEGAEYEKLLRKREQTTKSSEREEISAKIEEVLRSLSYGRQRIFEYEWPTFDFRCLHKNISYETYAESCSSPNELNSHFCSHHVVYAKSRSDEIDKLWETKHDRSYLDPVKGLNKVRSMLPKIEAR